jgi:ABC-2 type transport system permease protein/oleandomycin transport system permease protein
MSRLAVVAGRTVSDSIRNLAVILIMIGVGYLIGFRFQGGFPGALGMVGLSLLFGFALSWIFALVGMSVKDSETAQLASFVMIFPVTFASAAFVTIQSMPSWLQVFARNQPVSLMVEAARGLALGTPSDGAIWKILLWILGILIIFIPMSIRQYKRRTV